MRKVIIMVMVLVIAQTIPSIAHAQEKRLKHSLIKDFAWDLWSRLSIDQKELFTVKQIVDGSPYRKRDSIDYAKLRKAIKDTAEFVKIAAEIKSLKKLTVPGQIILCEEWNRPEKIIYALTDTSFEYIHQLPSGGTIYIYEYIRQLEGNRYETIFLSFKFTDASAIQLTDEDISREYYEARDKLVAVSN